jgi:putative endonuclease
MRFFYIYILQSEANPEHFYAGFTEDLQERLKIYNSGRVPHTAKRCPGRIKAAIAFSDRERADARALNSRLISNPLLGAPLQRRHCYLT